MISMISGKIAVSTPRVACPAYTIMSFFRKSSSVFFPTLTYGFSMALSILFPILFPISFFFSEFIFSVFFFVSGSIFPSFPAGITHLFIVI